MKEPGGFMAGSAHPRVFVSTKSDSMFKRFARRPARRMAFGLLTLLAIIGGAQTPVWSAGVTDIIWLESNSTAGNSILTFKNDGSGNPTFLGSTPAGGIGVFDKTFALGPFDSDQNLVVNDE